MWFDHFLLLNNGRRYLNAILLPTNTPYFIECCAITNLCPTNARCKTISIINLTHTYTLNKRAYCTIHLYL
uniref:Putative secreted protein n=1 Tax=Anopheles marajoara TaxID=58244 RepID=A0A2M4CE83_9DIPT